MHRKMFALIYFLLASCKNKALYPFLERKLVLTSIEFRRWTNNYILQKFMINHPCPNCCKKLSSGCDNENIFPLTHSPTAFTVHSFFPRCFIVILSSFLTGSCSPLTHSRMVKFTANAEKRKLVLYVVWYFFLRESLRCDCSIVK